MTISINTPGRLLFGAGTVKIDNVDVGATLGTTLFAWDMTLTQPRFHGAKGGLKGAGYISVFTPRVEVELAEIAGQHFAWMFPGLTLVSNMSSEVVSGWTPGCLGTGDYHKLEITVPRCNGKTTVITMVNAIVTSGGQLSFNDEGNPATIKLVFHGNYEPGAPTLAPFYIVNNI